MNRLRNIYRGPIPAGVAVICLYGGVILYANSVLEADHKKILDEHAAKLSVLEADHKKILDEHAAKYKERDQSLASSLPT